jgi:hypothetical protein
MDEAAMARLAREIAMNIRPVADILDDYGLDEQAFYELDTRNAFFRKVRNEFAVEWNATTSATDRVRAVSAAYLEQALPHLARRMMQAEEPLPAVTEVAKLFGRNAGLGEPKLDRASAERFQITINLGADSAGKPVIETYDKPLLASPAAGAIDLKPALEEW